MGLIQIGFYYKSMSSVFREESEQENGNFYSLYKEEDTLKKEVQPCRYRELLRFSSWLDKFLMALGCFFALGNGVSLIFYSQPLKDLVMAFDPHSDPQQILGNLTFAIKAFLVNSIFVFLNASLMTITWTLASQRQLIRVRNLYFQSLMKQQFAWYDRNKPEEVCSNMYMQTERAQSSLVESINSILTTISMGLGGIIFAFAHGWKMAIVMAGFIPVMMISNYVTTRLAKRWETKFVDRATNSNANVIQTFQNIKTVKYLGGQEYQISKFTQQVQTNSKYVIDYGRRTVFTSAITFFCIIFNYALGFWYGTKLVADRVYNSSTGKNYDVGDVVSIFFCVYIANLNISGLAGHITNFYNSRVALARIMTIVDRKPRQIEGTEDCIAGIKKIKFRDIMFHYSQPLFQKLNLTIEKGVVAIVGSSGNGKSTLLYLLMKFYDPFKGDILLHGNKQTQNLRDVQSKSLRKRIGYVGQEPVLLGNTIREVLGSVKEDAIWKALSICCAEDFVRNIGLDADFKALSGGQKQRIAIARAVLRNPQILVLDEGTSALDGINERKLLRNLKEKSKIQFIFMIAHRTETLSQAQTIIRVDKGNAEIIHSEAAVKIQQKSKEKQQAVEQKKQDGQIQQRQQQEQQKAEFKFSYLKDLLRLNGSMKQFYVTGILSSMFLGVIFPSFSYIITRLCSIVTNIQYATTTQEVQTLQQQANFISLFLLGISVGSIGLTIIKGRSFLALGENIGLKTRIYAFSHMIKLEMIEIQRIGRTNITHLINNNTSNVKQMASGLIANMSEHFFTLIVGLSIAFIYCWQITLVSLFLIPLSLIGGKLQQKFMSGLSQNSDKVYRKTHQIVKEAVIHNRTVKSLNMQESYCRKYKQEQSKGFRRSIKDSVLSGITLGVSQCLISLMLSLIYYIGALFVKHYGVTIVDLFTAIYAIMFSGVQAGCNIGFVGQIAQNVVGTARFFKLLGLNQQDPFGEEKLAKNELVQELQDESVLAINNDQIRGSVQFKSVSFKYPHRDEYVFRNLSFQVEEGKRVAIVGQSGSGKTTIADLLFKIYRPEQGEVLLDGVSTAIYSRGSLSQNLAIVSQEPALFNRSVIENIRYNAEVSEKEVKEAAKIANAFDFIEAGGFGVEGSQEEAEGNNWERVVGSRGSLLSGGQKQRVAIARAIVRKPRVMVFDEATSALDKETEQSLLLNVSKNLKMTQIIIAHRLSTIRACDAIIVLKEGQVVEYGEYEELVRKRGEFSRLVNALNDHP